MAVTYGCLICNLLEQNPFALVALACPAEISGAVLVGFGMNFARATIRSSPYVGVFCTSTDDYALVPHTILPKELKIVEEKLEARVIKASIGNSGLLGVLARGMGSKIAVSGLIEAGEKRHLEKEGLELLVLEENFTATGNLIALNGRAGIASPVFSEETVKMLQGFFGAKFVKMAPAGSELCGACITVTNKGLIANPNISEKDFERVESMFGVHGAATTANYGDVFVGNSVVANSKGALAGEKTSGIELSKIDEGLRGE